MKILILSDSFVKGDIACEILKRNLKIKETLELKNLSFDWPRIPFQKNNEISEYEGSIDKIKKNIIDTDIVILHAAPITEEVLNIATSLKAIGVIRGGPTNINLKAATKRGIPVFNTPGRNAVAVVEFTIGLILTELKNIARAHMNMMKGIWKYDYYLYEVCNFELAGKIVGLVGFGNIAWRISSILKAFGMNIISFDPYVKPERMAEYGVESVSFDKLLEVSDVVSVHARLTEQTQKIFNMNAFKKMKSSALFVNTARGGLVDYNDLVEALKTGKIAHAALDVFETEPINIHSPLLKLSNVTLTPHIAGATKDTVHYGMKILAEEISRFLNGGQIHYCMNPETLKKYNNGMF